MKSHYWGFQGEAGVLVAPHRWLRAFVNEAAVNRKGKKKKKHEATSSNRMQVRSERPPCKQQQGLVRILRPGPQTCAEAIQPTENNNNNNNNSKTAQQLGSQGGALLSACY